MCYVACTTEEYLLTRLGDGFCDDEINTEACEFDKGDCCGDNVNTKYCWDCECKEGRELIFPRFEVTNIKVTLHYSHNNFNNYCNNYWQVIITAFFMLNNLQNHL